ncbi:MAG TPA: hypothetical protein VJX67_07670 [Blastocatellia bacterium]|nr:hypothetical protein [Blastocatellia bacterium]
MKVGIFVASILVVSGGTAVFGQQAPSGSGPASRLGDYVPCQFTNDQESKWRQQPLQVSTEVVRQAMLHKANELKLANLQNTSPKPKGAFVQNVSLDNAIAKIKAAANKDELVAAASSAAPADAEALAEAGAAALNGPATFNAPDDVSCSQSIMSYKEASDILGRRIATRYVVVQVVVRNLSKDFDFILHDVQVAAPQGHFRAGRERVLARGVGEKGQELNRRNLIMNGLDTLSVTGQGASEFASADFNLGVKMLGILLPPLKKWFPDDTADQLRRFDEMAFSSSSAYKIVVPTRGSVPFVTFIPQEAFDTSPTKWNHQKFIDEANLMSVVVAGAHVQEVGAKPVVNSMTCPLSGDYLDLTKQPLVCSLKGQSLNLIETVRLSNADSKDKADGTVAITKQDATEANATFQQSDLQALAAPLYTALLEVINDGEQSTSFSFKLPNPSIIAVSPPQISLSQCSATKPCTFNVVGTNLDKMKSVVLAATDGATDGSESSCVDAADGFSSKCTLPSAMQTGTYFLVVVSSDDKKAKVPTHQKIQLQ